jgi:isopentenyl-diphosphate Delta-isomerase
MRADTRPVPERLTVSDAEEVIVALDADGTARPIGKLEAHEQNIRHRAVSIFVFDDAKLLMQQRADGKYHSPGLWANTCCSHPRWQEDVADCAHRRLREEMGFDLDLEPFGIVEYQARVGDLFENEVVHRFHGRYAPDRDCVIPNPDEVRDIAWMDLNDVLADIAAEPQRYAPWFRIYMREHLAELQAIAGRS